jgi:hypothetical protein
MHRPVFYFKTRHFGALHLKTETDSSLRNVFKIKDTTMDIIKLIVIKQMLILSALSLCHVVYRSHMRSILIHFLVAVGTGY